MTTEEKLKEIMRLKSEANTAKNRLGDIAGRLEELGAVRESKSLMTLIYKIEAWQHK